jgi:hypothetical protein
LIAIVTTLVYYYILMITIHLSKAGHICVIFPFPSRKKAC